MEEKDAKMSETPKAAELLEAESTEVLEETLIEVDEIKTKESLGYRVYDVKYKWSDNKNNVRDDRLQFLAYCFIYGVRGEIEDEDERQEKEKITRGGLKKWM